MSEGMKGLLICGGIFVIGVFAVKSAGLLTKLCYAALIGAYYRRTGKTPHCLNDKVAKQVAREFAEEAVQLREAQGGVGPGQRKEAVENMGLLAHKCIVDYCYRYATDIAVLRP